MNRGIFDYSDVIDCSEGFACFGEVTFLQDFGIFKKGQECAALYVDYEKATMQEQDEDGNDIGDVQNITLAPV